MSNNSFSGPASTSVDALKLLRRGVGVPVPSKVTFMVPAIAAFTAASKPALTSSAILSIFMHPPIFIISL